MLQRARGGTELHGLARQLVSVHIRWVTIATAAATSTAPMSAFLARWADMATWPDWNLDTEWVRLDGPFETGATGTLKPKGGPKVRFTVTRLDDEAFVDVSSMPGAKVIFDHRFARTDDGGTRIDVTVDITGPLALVWRTILGGGFAKTLQPDLDRLVATAELDVATTG